MRGPGLRQLPQQGVDAFVALGGVRVRAAADDPAEPPLRQAHRRVLARQHDVQQHAQRENIRPHVAAGKAELLRRGIAGRTEQARVAVGAAEQRRSRVQIQQHHAALLRQHDVFRLDVPVDVAEAVQRLQRGAKLARRGGRLPLVQQRPAQKIREQRPVDIFLLADGVLVRVLAGVDLRQLRRLHADELAAERVPPRIAAQDAFFSLRRLREPDRLRLPAQRLQQPQAVFPGKLLKKIH